MNHRRRREITSGTILLLGVITLGLHFYHLLSEENLYQILTGVVPPAVVSIGLIVAASVVYRSTLPDRHLTRILGWVLGGAVAIAALGSALMLYQMTHGAEISDAKFMVGNWAATGGLGGVIVGYYDAKLHETKSELAEERDMLTERRASLERQNQRLERLSHIVSHDLRNPLNVANGRVELAKETGDTSQLEPVIAAHDRMDSIIEDTLDMARFGQPIEEAEKEEVTLREIAEASWSGVDTREASLDVVGDLRFEADRSKLRSVFENLFRNAVEHGGSDVAVSVGPLKDETGFYVQDDGTGLPTTEDIFEPGYTTSNEGTGFGLAIVHDIVVAHGWNIDATTANGVSRFEITDIAE